MSTFWEGFEKRAAPRWRKALQEIIKNRDLPRAEKFVYNISRSLPRDVTTSMTPHSATLRAIPSIGKLPEGVASGGLDHAVRRAMKENYKHKLHVDTLPLKKRLEWVQDDRKFNRKNMSRMKDPKGWIGNTNKPVDPEDLIEISHAGGAHHIGDLLAGKTRGYKLENSSNTGIQVHPLKFFDRKSIADREKFYAGRGSVNHGDTPAVLTGKIKAKHLQGQPNMYEAGIPHDKIKHMENANIERLNLGDHGQYDYSISDKIKDAFKPFDIKPNVKM